MRTLVTLLLLAFAVRISPTRYCGNRKWMPFEDETGFGYAECECRRRKGHSGNHGGWLP